MTTHRSLEQALQEKDATTELYLSDLKKIPPEIGQLTNLEVLGLSKCKVDKLPAEMRNLTKLRELRVGGSTVREVPPLLLGLASVEVLCLCECPLAELPSLAGLPNLRCLEMNSTKIIDVSALSSAPGLRTLRY